jgi:hypothetical protein
MSPDPYGCAVLLALADSKYLGAANRADTLDRRLAILQGHVLWVLDLPLRPTLEAISLRHASPPSFVA